MRMRTWIFTALAASVPLAGCVDPDAGPTVLSGRPALQVGLDLVARGLPGGDAYGHLANSGVDSLVLRVQDLHVLEDGHLYQIWFVDAANTAAQRVDAEILILQDTIVGYDEFTGRPIIEWEPLGDPFTESSFVTREGQRQVIRFRAAELDAQGLAFADFSHVVLSIGEEAEDATPFAAPAPLWYRFHNQATGTRTAEGPLNFGFLPLHAVQGIGWNAGGGGLIEFLNVEGFGLQLNRIARPPHGFFYAVWVVNDLDRSINRNLGPLTTPGPAFESLRDADITLGSQVSRDQILRGAKWATWNDDIGMRPREVHLVYVTLEPKVGRTDLLPPTVVYQAEIPAELEELDEETVSRR